MARKTSRQLTALVNAAKIAEPAKTVAELVQLELVAIGKAADPRWFLNVAISNGVGGFVAYEFADDSGKQKAFSTVDSVIRAAAVFAEANDGVYSVTQADTAGLYASKVPADIYTDAENKVVKLGRIKTAQEEKVAALNVLLAGPMLGWDAGNAAQVARHAEVTAQVATITGDIAAITAEVVRLQAVVDSKP